MSTTASRGLSAAAVALMLRTAGASAAEPPRWPDSFVARLEALALIESLNADLLSRDSATLTLDQALVRGSSAGRSGAHRRRARNGRIEAGDRRRARRARRQARRAARLSARAAQVRRPRAVGGRQLVCASAPEPEMNHSARTTNTPFGKAVATLHFRRHTLSAELLWSPLPKG